MVWHVEIMDEHRTARRVLMAEVCGRRVRGRPRLGWMDGVLSLLCSGGYHLVKGGMPLHDAVWINCKKDATTEYQCADVKCMG